MDKGKTTEFVSLSNHFLIAMPQLHGSFFGDSIIYMWSHSEQGALGMAINLPLDITLADIFDQLNIEDQRPPGALQTVLTGGPVEKEKGFILHDTSNKWESTIEVTEDIQVTTSKDILDSIAHNQGPDNFLITLGCSGWEAGQLEQEIIDNSWIACPADKSIIFSTDFSQKPNLAAATLGFNMAQLTPDTDIGRA